MKFLLLAFLLAAVLPAAESRIVPGMNAFSVRSYRQLTEGNGNLILSPFNIATALSMALAGARGRTAQEIAATLHQHYDPSYNPALAALVSQLEKAGNTPGNELHMANALWAQQGLPVQPAFQKTLADDYHAPLTLLDFLANAEAARGQINRWVAQHTQDKIRDLLPAGAVDAQTKLVLTSAIYFYGKWSDPFLPSSTQPGPFRLDSGAPAEAKFMNQTAHFGYAELPSAQVLEMRYAATGIAFDVLLPKSPNRLADLEKSLTPEALAGWLGKIGWRKVQVTLPKFRAESRFSLRQTLSTMGMPAAFSREADFSGIDGRGRLLISEVVHKAFVDVAEEGTEAAAATGMTMRATAMRAPEPVAIFRADHPFLFLIRDTQSGVILFLGRLENPAA